ncbi:MAG: EF-P lysine aminoacylase EpmA [Pseudomonadota bacterium]
MASETDHWASSASVDTLRTRASLLRDVREFFFQRDVLEIETPLLGRHTVTAPFINSFRVQQGGGYLQTSPEYAMKRLLASGCDSIYQICKAFRQGERGDQHNSEFTMLEWYRVGFSLDELMGETEALITQILTPVYSDLPIERISYRDAFIRYANVDPFCVSDEELARVASRHIEFQFELSERDDYLDLLLSHCVEPHLGVIEEGGVSLCFMTDYPASQASLACVKNTEYGEVALRFEAYVNGIELANAYQELTDATALASRWEADQTKRMVLGLADVEKDERLLAAQVAGLPQCSGIALGLDRLLMLQLKQTEIASVIAFTDERA